MIYSRWRPDKGGFEYFENGERRGFGDDLPVPRTGFSMNPIGTASVSIGREPPGRIRKVGEGPYARGMVMPTSSAGLRGLPLVDRLGTAAIVAISFVSGVLLANWDAKRRRQG